MAEVVWEMADSTYDDAQGVSVWALVSAAGPDHDLLAVTVRDPGSDPTRASGNPIRSANWGQRMQTNTPNNLCVACFDKHHARAVTVRLSSAQFCQDLYASQHRECLAEGALLALGDNKFQLTREKSGLTRDSARNSPQIHSGVGKRS